MTQRYAGDWRPGASLDVIKTRAALLKGVRAFFNQRDVLEVETPLLGASFGTDPSIEPLESKFTGPGYPGGKRLFLQSSPEFFMKRLLATGSGPIYQVCKAFRNGEAGKRHNPEFTLLEWYRPGFSADQLMDEVASLICSLVNVPNLAVERLGYRSLFLDHLDLDPLEAEASELCRCALDRNLLGAEGMQLDRDGWLDLLMTSFIEPELGREGLTFVTDYPATQASLARIDPEDPRVAKRFELYWKGLELANGFEELADPDEQSERFEQENCRRYSTGQKPMPVDDALLSALEAGLPACSGVALGLDRLLMCQLDSADIEEVLGFSLARL